jgi:phage gpG-like protein
MTTEVTVRNLREVRNYLEGLPVDSVASVKTEISRTLLEVDRDIKTNTSLNRRTGGLFQSIKTEVSGSSLSDLKASIYTDSVYAPIHEYGGTVRAIDKYRRVPGGPYLNIPTDSNKTAAGVTRMQAREVFAMGGNVVKFRSGKYGVMLGSQIMFTLQKSSRIQPRLKMIDTAEDSVPTLLSRIAGAIG